MLSPEQRQEILKAVNEKISINHFIAGIQPPDPVDVVLSSDDHAPHSATPQQSVTVSSSVLVWMRPDIQSYVVSLISRSLHLPLP